MDEGPVVEVRTSHVLGVDRVPGFLEEFEFGGGRRVRGGRGTAHDGRRKLADPDFSALRAIDPRTGDIKWEHKFPTSSLAGVMSTASGVVFAGDNEGFFNAFEGKSGKRLWSYRTGSPIWGAAASTFMLDGRQQVLIESGNTLVAFAVPEK